MKIYSKFFDTESSFRNEDEVKAAIKKSKNYKNEDVRSAKSLNFFKTSKQRSYLIATDDMVYCVVDDNREISPKVNWSEKKSSFDTSMINIKTKTDRIGLIDFGEKHKNWFFTKSKFKNNNDLKEKLSELLIGESEG
ncbi:hypothetical protein [Aeromonas dhakensis]|uniref:hypothetical protein n=1 Tax=Aeromonas dhakensis TaxID=196024 RepID=UPI00191ED8FD|nr:hypothetical protein [Aeromonas dhakensis]MBL0459776.1 hypothetical protein [Aeromonas dhakensis]